MKTNLKSLMCVALTAATALSAAAQNRSAYFLDNYTYNYQLNPALGRDGNFDISMPLLGNLNIGVASNFGLESFIYDRNGQMTTFLSPEVTTDEAMKKFKERNRLGLDIREGILSVGFKALGGYNHVSINAVVNTQLRLPKSLFSFMKEGISNRSYDIGRFDVHADAYGEIALNHSHDLSNILPGLQVGASVKFLVGIANLDINMNKADLYLGEDKWTATTDGIAHVSLGGFDWKENDEGQIDDISLDSFSAPNGYGLAFDLGATYDFKDFTFGLAFNDIGFINWQHTKTAGTGGTHEFDSNNYIIDPNDFDDSFDKMKDDFTDLYSLRAEEGETTRCRAIEATMNASVEYTLPMYRQLSFGLLNTTRMAHRFAWTDFRLCANYLPVKWLGLTVNYGIGTFGSSFGWMLNIAPKGFNLYIGMDRTLGEFSKQYVPKSANAQLSFGINFPI